jgi:hypothetical protein
MDITVNANLKAFFQANLVFNSVFPVAQVLLGLFSANAERRHREQQIRLLTQMNEQLAEINVTVRRILKVLDALPTAILDAMVQAQLLVEWRLIDTVESQLRTVEDFRISSEHHQVIRNAFNFVCTNELRPLALAKLPRTAEVMNALSKADDQGFVRDQLSVAVNHIERHQSHLVRQMAESEQSFFKREVEDANRYFRKLEREHGVDFYSIRVKAPNRDSVADPRDVVVTVKRSRTSRNKKWPSVPDIVLPRVKADIKAIWEKARKKQQKQVNTAKAAMVDAIDLGLEAFQAYTAVKGVIEVVRDFDYEAAM